jgi:hypothetical protein
MRRLLLHVGMVTCLVGWLAWRYGAVILPFGAVTSQMPDPEDGRVTQGSYTNAYFGLSYPLPPEWTEGMTGPDPSQSGYYVLSSLNPKSELAASILVTAQDMFFGDKSQADAASAAKDFHQAMSEIEGMTVEREPVEVRIADRLVHRVDYNGVGLYRTAFVAEMRCHLVTFNLTARDPDVLASLALSLDKLSFGGGKDAASAVPICVKDYAAGENVLSKVEPQIVGPVRAPIPVRIIIGTDGGVKHVHVIHATAEQRTGIEASVHQWKMRPYVVEGRAVELETGLLLSSRQRQM